jgi:mannose-1-phosphate guanylyltransferase/mannose-6-phosphate isomerase
MDVYAVIMCGGSGSRLWPASRPSQPKQFIPLIGERSSFQETALRIQGVDGFAGLIIVAGVGHADAIRAQLQDINLSATLILEPEARDSAPAMAAAAAYVQRLDPNGVMVVLAADHHVPDAEGFARAASLASLAAAHGRIVTLGVTPRTPSSAYGYIAPGAPLDAASGAVEVSRFVEKPDMETAQRYLADGYLWNSGNFIVSAQTLLSELDQYAPGVAQAARAALPQASADGVLSLTDAFREAPKISIDYAVMEKSDKVAVLPVAFEWSDLGAWDAVWTHSAQDENGNAVSGGGFVVDSRNCLVQDRDGQTSVVIGLENVAVVTEAGQVLVCALDASQSVKKAFDRLRAEGRGAIDTPLSPKPSLIEWLDAAALPLWWALGADHETGGFQEELDAAARSTTSPRRIRVNARQAYVYGRAGARGWAGPWRQAAAHGIDYLLKYYKRSDGLFRTVIDVDGKVLDDTAKLYDQAFVLLALSASPDRAMAEAEAVTLRGAIQSLLRHEAGGYREADKIAFQSNPHMHLFEAALAWEEAGGDAGWAALADEVAQLCLTRFIDAEGGYLREFFDADWKPAPGIDGRRVEPGHQFEWSWLMERWAQKRGDAKAHAAARRLFEVGAAGIDPARNLAIDALDDDLQPLENSARLWPQTERLKAAMILSRRDDPGDPFRPHVEQSIAALWGYLDMPVRGLWRDRHVPGKGFLEGPSPASSLYHLLVAIDEYAVWSAP